MALIQERQAQREFLGNRVKALQKRSASGFSVAAEVETQEFYGSVVRTLEHHDAWIDHLQERSAPAPRKPEWSGNFGDYLRAVRNTCNGNTGDPRLLSLQQRAALGSNESVPSDGGFAVPYEFSTALLSYALYQSPLAGLCDHIPIKGNKISLPAFDEQNRADGKRLGGSSTGVLGYWINEADALIPTKAKFRMIELTAHKLGVFVYQTEELSDDAFDVWAPKAFEYESSYVLDEAILNGSGAGEPLGLLRAGALITVAKQSGQASASIVNQNIIDMFNRMLPECYRTAVWIVSWQVLPLLYQLTTVVGTGGSQSNLFNSTPDAEAKFGRLMGLPVVPCQQSPALGSAGDIMLADLNRYVLADRSKVMTSSMHMQFLTDQMAYRLILRVDGQPTVATTITPQDQSAARSAYVTLAAR